MTFAVAAAFVLKAVVEWSRGYWTFLEPDQYLSWRLRSVGRNPMLWRFLWRCMLGVRPLAAIGLILLPALRTELFALLAIGFAIELVVYFKFHTNFFLMICIGMTVAHLSTGLASDVVAFLLIAILMTAVYWSAAWHKMSKPFASGRILWTLIYFLAEWKASGERQFFDTWIPHSWRVRILQRGERSIPAWLPGLSIGVIVLQALLPLLLGFEETFWVGCAFGIALHAGMTMLFPVTLFHFSIASIGTYMAFGAFLTQGGFWRALGGVLV